MSSLLNNSPTPTSNTNTNTTNTNRCSSSDTSSSSSSPNTFTKFLHLSIHLLYLLIYYLYHLYSILSKAFTTNFKSLKSSNSTTTTILRSSINLNENKFPNHLTLTIDDSMLYNLELIKKKIENLIEWSFKNYHNCVHSLVLYDKLGILEENSKEIVEYLKTNFKIENNFDNNLENNYFTIKNGREEEKQLILNFTSFKSCGKHFITKMANEVVKDLEFKNSNSNSNSLEFIKNEFKLKMEKKISVDPPNLVISFSKPVLVLHGYSPLQVKYSQIVHLKKNFLEEFSEEDFVESVMEYVKCNQRFGK